MRDVMVNGRLVVAGPLSPQDATCPECRGAVTRRKRRGMDGQITYFYRHKRGVGHSCPRRAYP